LVISRSPVQSRTTAPVLPTALKTFFDGGIIVDMTDTDEKIQKLKAYFEERDDVVMVFLFGSRAKGYARTKSDWDIGVYFAEESRESEREVWADIEKIVGAETDMVVLNRAPERVAWSIARREPLIVKNRKKYLDFLIRASHEANDWYRTAEDYHRVFERSSSLSLEDRGRLEKIVQFLDAETVDFDKFEKLTWDEYQNEPPKRREVERWAEQLVNAVIDTSEIILASEKRVIPESYKEIVRQLGLIKSFNDGNLCARMAKWVTLRNILAHEYLDYRFKDLSQFITEAKLELIDFLGALREFLKKDII